MYYYNKKQKHNFYKWANMFVGVDIVDIERIKLAAQRTPRFLHRIFTPWE